MPVYILSHNGNFERVSATEMWQSLSERGLIMVKYNFRKIQCDYFHDYFMNSNTAFYKT